MRTNCPNPSRAKLVTCRATFVLICVVLGALLNWAVAVSISASVNAAELVKFTASRERCKQWMLDTSGDEATWRAPLSDGSMNPADEALMDWFIESEFTPSLAEQSQFDSRVAWLFRRVGWLRFEATFENARGAYLRMCSNESLGWPMLSWQSSEMWEFGRAFVPSAEGAWIVGPLYSRQVRYPVLTWFLPDGTLLPYRPLWPGFLINTALYSTLSAIVLLTLSHGLTSLRRNRRRRANHCPTCNYNRAGLSPTSPCPECGDQPTAPSIQKSAPE